MLSLLFSELVAIYFCRLSYFFVVFANTTSVYERLSLGLHQTLIQDLLIQDQDQDQDFDVQVCCFVIR